MEASASGILMPMGLATLVGGMATTIGTSTNLLVMNAGGYTFGDLVRIGLPLTLIMWLSLSWLLPRLYGF
jgi:di/tricarboxylate transporter